MSSLEAAFCEGDETQCSTHNAERPPRVLRRHRRRHVLVRESLLAPARRRLVGDAAAIRLRRTCSGGRVARARPPTCVGGSDKSGLGARSPDVHRGRTSNSRTSKTYLHRLTPADKVRCAWSIGAGSLHTCCRMVAISFARSISLHESAFSAVVLLLIVGLGAWTTLRVMIRTPSRLLGEPLTSLPVIRKEPSCRMVTVILAPSSLLFSQSPWSPVRRPLATCGPTRR